MNKHICSWFSSSKLPFFSISAQLHSLASVDFFLLFSLCMFSAHKMQADSVSKTTSSHDFVSCVSLCFHVERWPRLVIWRMDSRKNGDRKRIYKLKVPNCLSRFWYFAELVSSPIVTSLSFWFVISIHLKN